MGRIILFFLVILSSSSWAQSSSYVDNSHELISDQVERLADKLDSLFGDKRTDDEANESTLRVSQSYYWIDGKTGSYDVEASFNLKLPNLEKREQALRQSLRRQREKEAEESDATTPRQEEEKVWDFGQESGVRFSLPLGYYLRGRARRSLKTGPMVHYFYEQLGWDSRDHWGSLTSLTSDTGLTRDLLFRIVNEASWGISNLTFATVHGLSLLSNLNDRTGVSYDARFFTKTEDNQWYQERYSLSSSLRLALPKGWAFLELTPEIAWRREDTFVGKLGFFIKLELIFGGDKSEPFSESVLNRQ